MTPRRTYLILTPEDRPIGQVETHGGAYEALGAARVLLGYGGEVEWPDENSGPVLVGAEWGEPDQSEPITMEPPTQIRPFVTRTGDLHAELA